MTHGEIGYAVVALVLNGTVVLAVIKLYVDRKANKAHGIVETSTVGSKISAAELANETTSISNLAKRLEFVEKAHDSERKSWAASLRDLRERTADLTRQVGELRAEVRAEHVRYRTAVSYIRTLLAWINTSASESHTAPPVPAGLDLDD